MTPNPTYLPLETLIQMLERRGIPLTPDQKVRAQKLLTLLGKKGIESPENLRNYLCPIVAKDGLEQERFYKIFAEWLERHVQPPKEKPVPRPEVLEQARLKWLIPAIISGLLAVGLLIWLMITSLAPDTPPKPKPFFSVSDACVQVNTPIVFTNQSPDSGTQFLWNFGDAQTDTNQWNAIHTFPQSGTYAITLNLSNEGQDSSYTRKIFVYDTQRPQADFTYQQAENEYAFTPNNSDSTWIYQWNLGEGGTSNLPNPKVSLSEGANHTISLTVSLANDSSGFCADRSSQAIDLQKELVELPPLAPIHDPGRETERQWKKGWIYAWFIGWLLLLAIFPLAYYRYRRRPPDTPEFRRSLIEGDSPPVEIPFPSQDNLIGSKGEIQTLAQVLRRRETGERAFLDIDATMRKTIHQGGYPVLSFQKRSRPVEYLALVEVRGPNDQQARFFRRFLELLQSELVPIEIWLFQEGLNHCYRPGIDESVTLNHLSQIFSRHRLMIFGTGESLLDTRTNSVRESLESILPVWEEKALLTPHPVADWGRRERSLREYFAILPGDLEGQMELLETWDERDPPDFRTLQRKLLKERPLDPALMDFDLSNVEDIRAYLGETRFRWLAAAALYPRPVWELTLALAEGLEKSHPSYQDLLTITRLPWLQDGDLPEGLRAELIDNLDTESERAAREILLELLDFGRGTAQFLRRSGKRSATSHSGSDA